ncbi:meiotic cell cortex C-terminal pleckstrin homology-domain-containing protein [Paraphoma chrysanthemicola]|uniref:Meiotic cell cortex C-terminal pleckstrin homology-domain-containing protein n=1 Tax=Paraphoma chrysanthemicola TaxID=798071 RepID=A0A8K0RE66_9PLEO|nr:meiotic cell cortex C-terminal pleckstrin homology-domain-containing protein [Paraphoma chrysanthemicola]
MATDYFSDNEAFISSHPLPSPAGTPYHSVSRRTSRYGTPVSDVTSSPPPLPPDPYMNSEDTANDENISILDPRRFTPTLHANLVSEILNLRRELDSKHRFIEDLETNLHATRGNNDSLTQQLASASKEARNAKRQLQHFENETVAALEEIAGERDKMKEANADLKVKLEAAQKKTRSQEEDSTRVHDMWAREKEVWAGEKLVLERRVHTSDTRLKILLDEIALHEAAHDEAGMESEGEDIIRDMGFGPESDTASIRSSPQRRSSTRLGRHSRNRSNSSFRSIGRNYRTSLMSADGHGRSNGICLADELIFDEEEEDLGELELDSDDFPENEMRARRALESRQSMYPDEKAKRILGLSIDNQQAGRDDTLVEETEAPKTSYETVHSSITLTPRDITLVFPPTRPIYVDSGVQPSPPCSPTKPTMAEAASQTVEVTLPSKSNEAPSINADIEANQRRKRVSMPRDSPSPPPMANSTPALMTSSSVQTIEQPLSPPDTPKVPFPLVQPPLTPVPSTETVSAATQTEPLEEPSLPEQKRAPAPPAISIPSIAIHAPSSAPSSPKEPILPPGTKTVSTQTTGDLAAPVRSYGMQTEPIRIDQRAIKLPAHLLPSAVTSKPGTPEPDKESRAAAIVNRTDSHHPSSSDTEQPTAKLVARQDLTALLEKAADKKIENRYPGNNDNGPLSKYHQADILSRPFRTSSLFAGFDGPSSDEEDDDAEVSDDDLRSSQFSTPMLSSRHSKNSRPFKPPTPVPEDKEAVPSSRMSEDSTASNQMTSKRSSIDKPAKVGKPARNSLSRQPSIRRSAMIQNGTAAHVRSRSPSIGSLGSSNYMPKPPFPVPTRSSSRNKPVSKSEGSQSPTPRNSGSHAGRRPYGVKHQRKDSLRKVRSAAPVSKPSRSRSRSPTLPATPSIAETNSIPPLPSDIVSASGFGHRHQFSTATAYTANGSINTSASQTSVVDAIAASMIGEFMWKYVRKRKAFGGPDTPTDVSRAAEEASLASHGVRHRRWVWISPYERAILWSSKQPTSGSALMGKSGRKLVIQSVLDVADSCPPPKNEVLFNRSILILTPARALKFTTTSRERHYLWLTALSFLAHSNSPMPDLGSMPPVPPPLVEEPLQRNQGATLRRSRVQDSVRLAKGKANPVMQRYASQQDMPTALPSLAGFDRPIPDSASPPTIPRGPHHGRKRSSTGPSAPPPNVPFRSFSHQHVPSVYSNGSSDMYSAAAPPSVPSTVYNPNSGAISSRTSEASTSTRRHFFDTMGTVRMEAFIDNALGDGKHAGSHATRSRMHSRRRGSSQWSASTRDPSNRAGGFFDDFEVNDPFRGF